MQQKVWVIGDQEMGESAPRSPAAGLTPAREPVAERPNGSPATKNPALAFSLSLLVWGGGQLYLGERRRGAIYMAAMALFLVFLAELVLFRGAVARLIVHFDIRPAVFLFAVAAAGLTALAAWATNAVSAYFQATRTRPETFLGVENGYLSLFCSALVPGWGQFLNGQPRKGLLFLLAAVTAFFSLVVLLVARYGWPLLEADPARRVFEVYLGVSLLLLPLFLVLWITAAYDSFRSCKVLFRKSMSFRSAGYRSDEHIRVRDTLPRTTAVLSLLLAISLGMQFFPKDYYKKSLEQVRTELQHNNVEIIPELIHSVARAIERLK